MRFLSATGKVGRLTVTGADGPIDVLVDGASVMVAGAQMDDAAESVFELLRVTSGPFLFDDEHGMPDGLTAYPVDPVLDRAGQLRIEWDHVSTLIPSAHHPLALCDDLPEDSVTVNRDEWRLMRRLAAGGTVTDFSHEMGVSVVSATRRMATLVERGLAVVHDEVVVPAVELPVDVASSDELLADLDTAPIVSPSDMTLPAAPMEAPDMVQASLAAFFAQQEGGASASTIPESSFAEIEPTPLVMTWGTPAPDLVDQAVTTQTVATSDNAMDITPDAGVDATDITPDAGVDAMEMTPGSDVEEPEHRALLYRFLSSVRS